MDTAAHLAFASWQNFYVILGSSAGALTGLQFIVLTLIAQASTVADVRAVKAFGTPTLVHFCTALLTSALMTAPWRSSADFAICLAIVGGLGVLYCVRTFWHARKATYNPDIEDWIWYSAMPFLAHLGLIATATMMLSGSLQWSLWSVAADTLLFLLIGIHNSWDTITYIVLNHVASKAAPDPDIPAAALKN